MIGALSRTPKGCSFNSQSGHISRLRAPSPVRVHAGGSRLMMFFSHPCFSLSLPSSIKNQLKKKRQHKEEAHKMHRWGPPNTCLSLCSEQTHGREQTCGLLGEGLSLWVAQGQLTVYPPACRASFLADLCQCLGSRLCHGRQTHLVQHPPCHVLSAASAAAGPHGHDPWPPPLL